MTRCLSQYRGLHFDRHLTIADRICRLRGDQRLAVLEDERQAVVNRRLHHGAARSLRSACSTGAGQSYWRFSRSRILPSLRICGSASTFSGTSPMPRKQRLRDLMNPES